MSAKEYLLDERTPSMGQEGTRAALYLRISTADQKPDLQLTACALMRRGRVSISSRIIAMSACQVDEKAALS